MAAKIRKGDTVEILAGKNKGARGKVMSVNPRSQRVVVEGLNIVKRHTRPSATHGRGGIVEKPAPIHVSNVALVHGGAKTRVGFKVVDGEKVRWSRTRDEAIDA